MTKNNRLDGQVQGDYFFDLKSTSAITSITNIIVKDIDSYVFIAPSPFII